MRYPDTSGGLTQQILQALKKAGKNTEHLSTSDLIALDEIHIRGRKATRELVHVAGFPEKSHILDIGSGVGGPARTLASEYGFTVTGIEISADCCEAARELNRRTGLDASITITCGDATEMPFDDASFDGVVMLHSAMNIADKRRLLMQIHRVLRDGGKAAIYEILAGPVGNVHFPVIWADNPAGNHLIHADRMLELITETGFDIAVWNDVTTEAHDWFRDMLAKLDTGFRPALSLETVVGPDFVERGRNVFRNLQEHRIEVVEAVLTAGT